MQTQNESTEIAQIGEDGSVSRTRIEDPGQIVLDEYYIVCGTVAYSHIVRIFGLPTIYGDGYKIDAMWVVRTPAGLAIVHNFKNGRAWNGPEGKPTVDITHWTIRGVSSEAVEWIEQALE